MAVLDKLQPEKVFYYFEKLCSVPHGSGNTKQISDLIVSFAEEHGFEYYQDELNNVIIIKEASRGCEKSAPVIIQGHIDMVCEKAPDCTKDMEHEGLDLAVDGDTVYSKGTTLGGDDGIAIAMGLALLDDDSLRHPRIELLCTVDEEVGMDGAFGVDLSPLKGRTMINIDSEEEGIFTVGCAGGCTATCRFDAVRDEYSGRAVRIKIAGLKGGHSGEEIDKFRANADMLMGRLLYKLKKSADFRIASVDGGLKNNAIPTACTAEIFCSDAEAVKNCCEAMDKVFAFEYSSTDGNITVTASELSEAKYMPMSAECTDRIITFLLTAPNGIQEMSPDIKGLVETSLNLGILTTNESMVSAQFCIRSSVESRKDMMAYKLQALSEGLGGECIIDGGYPGWKYNPSSNLRELMVEIFKKQYGHEPVVKAIHAGLECGLFMDRLPDLDCISIGPDITDIHTFSEKLHIESVQRTWKLVTKTIECLSNQK